MQRSINFQGRTIPVNGTILQSLEQSNANVASQCREGFCGVCRLKLRKGKVSYIKEPLGFIDDDEILSCCAMPETNVDVDLK